MSRSLIVLPDDTAEPILAAIGGAKQTLRVKMFVFSDPALLAAVIAAHKRGVDGPRDAESRAAQRRGRERGDAQGADRRPACRCRTAIPAFDADAREVDGGRRDGGVREVAQLGDGQPHETRDYAVVTDHRHEVDGDRSTCFEADWHRTDVRRRRDGSR